MPIWQRPFLFLAWFFSAMAGRFEEWLFTRRLRLLAEGIPALFVAGACLAVLPRGGSGLTVQMQERYSAAIEEAIRSNDLDTAELFLHKLLQLNDKRADVRYRLALLAERRGQRERAATLMAELAPDNHTGHAGAHLWRAKQLLASKREWTSPEIDIVVHHLQGAQRDPVSHDEAANLLGQLYMARQQYAEAAAQFSELVKSKPHLGLMLAKAYLGQGNQHLVKRELASTVEHLQKQLQQNPGNSDIRLWLAEAYRMQGLLEQADQTLRGGLDGDQAQRFRLALADLCVLRFDTASTEKDASPDARFEYLEEALQLVPNHQRALVRLAGFVKHEGEQGSIARAEVERALASGKAAALLHMVLGTKAAQDRDLAVAKLHLSQARELEPNSPVILNNLAWVMAHQDPPQLKDALVLINTARHQAPQDPRIRETRGQILVKLERWQEALVDLEIALRDLAGNPELHATLALVYEKLGDKQMAEQHRQRTDAQPKPTAPLIDPEGE